MFAKLPEALSDMKDNFMDEGLKKISQGIHNLTNGTLNLDSITKGQIKINGNEYIDKVLNILSTKLKSNNNIQDIHLPNHTIEFEKPFLCGILIPGQVELIDGFIKEISDLSRIDDAQLEFNAFEEPLISAKAILGIKEATVGSLANITLACLTADDAQVNGGLKDIQLTIIIKVGRNLNVILERFDIQNTGSLSLGFENLGSFDFLEETISGDLESSIKQSIREHLQKTVKTTIDDIVNQLPFKI